MSVSPSFIYYNIYRSVCAGFLRLERGGNKGLEQRVRLVGAAFKLRMKLHAHKPRVPRQLHHLHQPPVRREAGKAQPGGSK